MGVMKRIATARQWNESLAGGRTDPEIAAMRRLYLRALDEQRGPEKPQERVTPPRADYQGELPF